VNSCRRAIRYFHRDWKLIAALIVCIGISYVLGLIKPWSIGMFLDLVAAPSPRAPTDTMHRLFLAYLPASPGGKIFGLAFFGLAVAIVEHGTWFLGRVMLNKRIRYNGLARVRLALYHKFQHLALDYHRTRPQGDTIYRLSTDTQGFFNILDTLIGAAVSCITLLITTTVMLLISVRLTCLALAVVPPLVVANIFFARAINRRALIAKQADSDFTTTVQQSMGAIGVIQLFCRHAADYIRFKSAVERSNDRNWRLNWFDESLYPLAAQMIFAGGAMLIFGVGGMLAYHDQIVVHDASGVTFGSLIVFLGYVPQLNEPLGRITGFRAAIQTNLAAAERVFVILDTPVSVTDHAQASSLPLRSRTLTLEDVCFAYPTGTAVAPRVLSNIDATIAPGQFVAFVGASGAGKTTLFSLLPRFYDPTSGAIRLDEHDVRHITLADLRRHIAMVQQDCPLFPGTIGENIAFARPDATRLEIIAAATAAGAHRFIAHMEKGYDTPVAENASNLSGGQRQRLALARALLANAPILLLDEPTSAQDPNHAAAILETIKALKGSRTILLVTHDLGLAEQADLLFVMQQGRIAESGTPAELLATPGLYHTLRNAASPATLQIAS